MKSISKEEMAFLEQRRLSHSSTESIVQSPLKVTKENEETGQTENVTLVVNDSFRDGDYGSPIAEYEAPLQTGKVVSVTIPASSSKEVVVEQLPVPDQTPVADDMFERVKSLLTVFTEDIEVKVDSTINYALSSMNDEFNLRFEQAETRFVNLSNNVSAVKKLVHKTGGRTASSIRK